MDASGYHHNLGQEPSDIFAKSLYLMLSSSSDLLNTEYQQFQMVDRLHEAHYGNFRLKMLRPGAM